MRIIDGHGVTTVAPLLLWRNFMPKKKSKQKWLQDVTDNSDAMDLKGGVFKQRSAKKIADLLKASAEQSDRRKATPFQSAMSMLNFYINCAGSSCRSQEHARLDIVIGEAIGFRLDAVFFEFLGD